ncbi:MAG: RagB/SusD family nutrient uptake outer membrane protein [Carboxylicivirga sp.]|jgi:hypothetical protein|nr:RagB/SusD family nutrient uptake outer membrane protein [Carboxylicivirga sp.]
MKKYFIIALVAVLSSCNDYLDITPDNLATVEMAFDNRNTAEQFLATCYSYVPDMANPEQNFSLVAGDEIWYYGEKDYYMNNQTSLRLAKGMQNVNNPYCDYWEGDRGGFNMWIAIRDCNIFLVSLHDIPGLETNERLRWLAEVKALKAYFYYWMLEMYGPLPIIDTNIPVDATTEETQVERASVDAVVEYIVSLCDEAIESEAMPANITFIKTEYGRLTLSAVKAIKAKTLVLAASPLFNGNTDYAGFVNAKGEALVNQTYDAGKWKMAADACLDAIQTAEENHQLYNFIDLLPIGEVSDEVREELTLRNTITDRFNSELIWGLGNTWVRDLQTWCQPRFTSDHSNRFNETRKSHAPTLNVVETFYTKNGVPIKEDETWEYTNRYEPVKVEEALADDHKYSLQNGYTTAKLHTYREPRFYAYVGFDGGKWFSLETKDAEDIPFLNTKAGQLSGKAGQELYSITGYFTKKLVNYENVITTTQQSIVDYTFPIIRLSDLYLMYAEALNEFKDKPDAEVYKYIQLVRHKAGLDKGSDLVTTWQSYSNIKDKPTRKAGMREIIQQERMIELAFEGHRYWDLRRWKLADEYFNEPIRGWNIAGAEINDFYQVKNIFMRNYLKKDYLWPISSYELLRNPKLVQNPGWE